ncbi:MAG: elongation factor 1-beta [Candidatus Aenigmatarchaeota archaeon]
MAQVLAIFRVMPKSVDTNLDSLEEQIKNSISPEKIERKPIAFGIVALNVYKFMEDAEGEIEKIENKIKNIESVGEVEVLEVTRSL